MHYQFTQLARNLRSGARLALFMPVERLAFRIGAAELLALFVLSALLDFGGDWVRFGPDPYFSWLGGGSELFSAGLLLLTATVLGLAFRQRALIVALPVIVLSALPVVQLVHAAYDAAARWAPTTLRAVSELDWLLTAWVIVVLVRVVATALLPVGGHRWWRAIAGGLVLAAPLWLAPALMPSEPWWRQPAVQGGIDPRYPNPASEPVLTAQASLLDDALAALEDGRPGVTDLYFVAFGGVAAEDVFRKDVDVARKIMDARWDTAGRSVTLLNNPRTLLQTPIATVSNLRETLQEMAAAMNPDQDVAMIYLASHGSPGALEVSLPPLELAPLTPTVLRGLLDESGIKWRIVIVSACYSGTFIPALEDDHTVVITASQADRSSFGCGYRSDGTYFGEAMFQQGLAKEDSLTAAFDRARRRVAEREAADHLTPPSNPQIWIGSAMVEKLKQLDRGSAGRQTGQLVSNWGQRRVRAGAEPNWGQRRVWAGGTNSGLIAETRL